MAHAAPNRLDLVGCQFGQLKVEAIADGRGPRGELLWRCRCACGSGIVRNTNKLRTGHTKSCGCRKRLSGEECPNADRRPILDRLAERSYVVLATGCKIWTGHCQHFGHGYISILGERKLVHRAAWEAERGPIPDGLDCLHDCPGGDNPACWNVEHLWLGTQGDNNADRDRKGRHVALKGEDHGCARLTATQVVAIRADTRLNREIADEYGISFSHVGRIKSRSVWGHIP